MILGNNALNDFSDGVLANKFEQAKGTAETGQSLSEGFGKSAARHRACATSAQDNNSRLRNSYRFE